MSKLNEILDAVVEIQNALGLSIEGKPMVAAKRALPKHEEPVDLSHAVYVSGLELVELTKRFAFGSNWYVQYRVLITAITPNERDAMKGLVEQTDWRDATRGRFMQPGALTPFGASKVEIAQGAFLERGSLTEGYNYNQVALIVTTYERRG